MNHESQPRMVCTNVPGNEQELSNTKNVFGKNRKSLKCRRMNGKTGIVEEQEFSTRAVSWHGCNFGMHKVADPIKVSLYFYKFCFCFLL